MIKVYLAGPYSTGNVGANVNKHLKVADKLWRLGFCPFAPIVNSHLQHLAHPRSYNEWIEYDLVWLKVCDCMLRLSGASPGADIEEKFAKDNNIPVFYSIPELIKWTKAKKS